jgi:hypothetical protein
MSRRIAHRPRYRDMRYLPQPSQRTHKDYFRQNWTYRRLNISYQKITLGQGLLMLPVKRLIHSFKAV